MGHSLSTMLMEDWCNELDHFGCYADDDIQHYSIGEFWGAFDDLCYCSNYYDGLSDRLFVTRDFYQKYLFEGIEFDDYTDRYSAVDDLEDELRRRFRDTGSLE